MRFAISSTLTRLFGLVLLGVALGLNSVPLAAAEPAQDAESAHRTYLQVLRSEKRFPTAASCSQCHPDHYTEWSMSPHEIGRAHV